MSGRCKRCVYGAAVSMGDEGEMLCACTYILRKGHRRPCPPGEDCAVYEPALRRREAERRENAYHGPGKPVY